MENECSPLSQPDESEVMGLLDRYLDYWTSPLTKPAVLGIGLWRGTAAATTQRPASGSERALHRVLADFVTGVAAPFSRRTLGGHITGSALVTNPERDAVLLTLHAKLGKWLQLGGHSDGDPIPWRVAWREASEESGLDNLRLLTWGKREPSHEGPIPLDIDFHLIPRRGSEPTHIHYDIRFLIEAPFPDDIRMTHESRDLRWFSLAEARELTQETSMLQQFDKLDWLRAHENLRTHPTSHRLRDPHGDLTAAHGDLH